MRSSPSRGARSIGVSASQSSIDSACPSPVWLPISGWHRRPPAEGRNRSPRRRTAWQYSLRWIRRAGPSAARIAASIVSGGPSAAIASGLRAQACRYSTAPRLAEAPAEALDVADQPLVAAAPRHRPSGRPACAAPAPARRGPRSAGSPARSPPRPGTRRAAPARSCGWSGSSARPGNRAPGRTVAAPFRWVLGSFGSPSANRSFFKSLSRAAGPRPRAARRCGSPSPPRPPW